MRRYRRLSKLCISASKRLNRIERRAEVAPSYQLPHKAAHEIEAEVATLAIDLLNTWTNTIKWLYISCALGARSRVGTPISSSLAIPDANDAIGIAVQAERPWRTPNAKGGWDTRSEPTWHDPSVLGRVASAAKLSSAGDMTTAFSTGFRVFGHLPVFRNYFAHRNQETFEKAMNIAPDYGVGRNAKPSDVLRAHEGGGPSSVLATWAAELRFTIEYLCN